MYGLQIQRDSQLSFTQQLLRQIREAVLQGRLKSGERLPPSRELAKDLGVARNVIIQVYEQLLAEGYLESRTGSGTYVAELAVQRFAKASRPPEPPADTVESWPAGKIVIDFNPGTPDLGLFPRTLWGKTLKNVCLEAPDSAYGYGPPLGEPCLRSAIAGYLFRSKGILCGPERIVIVSGAVQGVDLLSKILRTTPGSVVLEDPCDGFTRQTFASNGERIIPVPVDEHGMQTEALPEKEDVKLIYAVPSHQYPIGGILPIRRRLELLKYAEKKNAVIIEDDYDSEFRYRGEPIESLYNLAPDKVVYLGTFSKTFSPGLRLAFMILPENLMDEAFALKKQLNMRTPPLIQLAMARFIECKAYDRHVYKMKKIYAAKRKHLIESLQSAFGDGVRVGGENAGLHLLADFTGCAAPLEPGRLREYGVIADSVDEYAVVKGKHPNQLVLGYGGLTLEQISEGVRRIKLAFSRR